MLEQDFIEQLQDLLAGNLDSDGVDAFLADIRRVLSFLDAGLLTLNSGLVVKLRNGSEYQLTIIKKY